MARHTRSIPQEQQECLADCINGGRKKFITTFCAKYGKDCLPSEIYNRASYLWTIRSDIVPEIEIARRRADAASERQNRTVMIPARIVSKAQTSKFGDGLPDTGEILIKQNHLLAEIVVLQKEQITILQALLARQPLNTTGARDDAAMS